MTLHSTSCSKPSILYWLKIYTEDFLSLSICDSYVIVNGPRALPSLPFNNKLLTVQSQDDLRI